MNDSLSEPNEREEIVKDYKNMCAGRHVVGTVFIAVEGNHETCTMKALD